MFALSKKDYLTVRNEIWNDPQGERTGFSRSTPAIRWADSQLQRGHANAAEVGFYHSYGPRTFDLGTTRNMMMAGFDFTFRF